MSDIYLRYFVFSQQQMELKKSVELKLGRKATFGTVIVNGSPKVYTDVLASMSTSRFGDAVVLTSGDIRSISYTDPA